MLLVGSRVAQGQPGTVGAEDCAVNEPHALIFHAQIEIPLVADGQNTEIDLLRFKAQTRFGENIGGQFLQQLIESAIGIGEFGGFLGGEGEIDAAESAEEISQVALREKIASGGPFFLTGQGQLVEAVALPTAREDEGIRERLRADSDGAAIPGMTTKDEAIKVAIDGIGRIGPRTFAACLNHDTVGFLLQNPSLSHLILTSYDTVFTATPAYNLATSEATEKAGRWTTRILQMSDRCKNGKRQYNRPCSTSSRNWTAIWSERNRNVLYLVEIEISAKVRPQR